MSRHCAIVGMDVTAALGAGIEEVWAQMMRGSCGIRPMRRLPHGRYTTDFAAEVPSSVEAALRAKGGPNEDSLAYLMALATCRRMLRSLAGGPERIASARTGLVLTTTKAEVGQLERLAAAPGAEVGQRHNAYVLARDVAAALGLTGPVVSVSNACASGLIGIIQAAQLLRRGDAEMMVVVGVDVLAEFILAGFSALNALSAGPCRTGSGRRGGCRPTSVVACPYRSRPYAI